MTVVIMIQVITRKEEESITKGIKRMLIYGRRKTGKTYFVRNFLKHDKYFFVTREGNVFFEENVLDYNTFFSMFKELVKEKIIVVDEFHRLPKEFVDYLHYISKGNIVLVTSTLWLAIKMIQSKGWPLAGVFTPIRFSLIDERDILVNLSKYLKGKELIEASVYLREPILIERYTGNIRKTLVDFFSNNRYFIKNLIGEIFTEEERTLTKIYENILKAIAAGKCSSTEISSFLFSNKLIDKDNPGLIQRHLQNLVELGIIRKFEVYKKRKNKYAHVSPLLDLHFYLEEKYDYTEQKININYIQDVVNEKIPLHAEQFFGDLFSKIYGLKQIKIEEPEVDVALLKFKKLEMVGEVKWREKINVLEIEKRLSQFNCKKFIVSVKKSKSRIKSYGVAEILRLAAVNR